MPGSFLCLFSTIFVILSLPCFCSFYNSIHSCKYFSQQQIFAIVKIIRAVFSGDKRRAKTETRAGWRERNDQRTGQQENRGGRRLKQTKRTTIRPDKNYQKQERAAHRKASCIWAISESIAMVDACRS